MSSFFISFQGVTIAVLIAIGRINAIFKFTGPVTWTLYGASFMAVFILRHKSPNQSKHFKVTTSEFLWVDLLFIEVFLTFFVSHLKLYPTLIQD